MFLVMSGNVLHACVRALTCIGFFVKTKASGEPMAVQNSAGAANKNVAMPAVDDPVRQVGNANKGLLRRAFAMIECRWISD